MVPKPILIGSRFWKGESTCSESRKVPSFSMRCDCEPREDGWFLMGPQLLCGAILQVFPIDSVQEIRFEDRGNVVNPLCATFKNGLKRTTTGLANILGQLSA